MTQQLSDRKLDTLAAEYVLGTLEDDTRLKLQRLMVTSDRARKAVWHWEQTLNALGASLNDVQPSSRVWRRIEARLGLGETEVVEAGVDEPHQNVTPLRTSRIRQGWVWPAIAAALVLVMISWNGWQTTSSAPAQVAVIQDASAQALWSVNLTEDGLLVTSTRQVTASSERDYELWLVAADGRAPVSLGLLPESGQRLLPRNALFDAVDVEVLAVSREPEGGSPTGQPTEVLYTAQLVGL
ncbi:anti-sigma factor [Saccharospirillum impatiens]|uniref:anti-sigma factor n=1 Tax=Saccharospirillum impatiens TaxID=169438 RepID=UPI0003F9D258|nr:anti-sigma factor [Saccharospirillum impatiens]